MFQRREQRMLMEEFSPFTWNIHPNQFKVDYTEPGGPSCLFLSRICLTCKMTQHQRAFHGSTEKLYAFCVFRIFLFFERKTEEQSHILGVPPYPLLLPASALDYGSPLFYVITKAANSFWQLWPALKITEQLRSLSQQGPFLSHLLLWLLDFPLPV